MKKTKILSLLLCLSLLCALLVPGPAAHADAADSGMKISKTAKVNADGSYTITLEAFATGEKVTTVVEEDVPTDIILVLDQSGSMEDDIGTVAFEEYRDESDYWGTTHHTRNRDYYDYRHNGGSANLWHKLADGSYVSVSVTKTQGYTALGNLVNYKTDWDNLTAGCYYYYANNLYEKVGEEYKRVSLTEASSGPWYDTTYTYTYTFSDGTTVQSVGRSSTPNLDTHAPLYTPAADGASTVYTYTYTDANGVTQTIGTSTGADTVYTPAFYKKVTRRGGGSKLAALQSAATTFVNAVAAKAAGPDGNINTTEDNVNHRIAVVGYADTDSSYGANTGVFIGSNLNRYPNNAPSVYASALQDMDTTSGKNNVTASLNALQHSGATRTDFGLIMAKGILDANPVPAGEKRNRVVIVFTDGSPTDYNGFQIGVANRAISTAGEIKAGGATVYSIGIFSGADATSAGIQPSGNLDDGDSRIPAACNWFMQNVSSNGGTPQSPSYYLSASDSGSLSNIFQQISSNIETGGSSTKLDSSTVVKDIISPSFTLPDGATASSIQIDTYECTEKDGDTYTWATTSSGNGGATATVNGDQVSVTGFNFSENWCGIEKDAQGNGTVRGKKLVISFTVSPKPGFLGGNDVPTNKGAGIYKDNTTEPPVLEFEKPTVNVPIKDVTVTAADKNVYLLGTVTAEQLKSGATVTVGNVNLDLNATNYGLETWQTEYVDIDVKIKGADGTEITTTGLSNLSDDTTYTIEVTVSPKTSGSTPTQGTPATEKTGTGTAKINVFKPALTFKDSTAYYGESVPANNDYSGNKVGDEKWMHGTTDSTIVTMLGDKPTLGITYTPDASKIKDGKYTKQDVPVKATVSISGTDVTNHTTFEHQACNPACDWEDPTKPGDPAFLIHVKTCTLKITKQGGASDESYVFDVLKDGTKYSEVTVWGNGTETLVELPVGNYTITENTGWSWRYSASYSGGATLSAATPEGTITCTNAKNNDQWLNGFSEIVRNIFGQSRTN